MFPLEFVVLVSGVIGQSTLLSVGLSSTRLLVLSGLVSRGATSQLLGAVLHFGSANRGATLTWIQFWMSGTAMTTYLSHPPLRMSTMRVLQTLEAWPMGLATSLVTAAALAALHGWGG